MFEKLVLLTYQSIRLFILARCSRQGKDEGSFGCEEIACAVGQPGLPVCIGTFLFLILLSM